MSSVEGGEAASDHAGVEENALYVFLEKCSVCITKCSVCIFAPACSDHAGVEKNALDKYRAFGRRLSE